VIAVLSQSFTRKRAAIIALAAALAFGIAQLHVPAGTGAGCACVAGLIAAGRVSTIRALVSAALAGVLGAYLVHLANLIVGPAWPQVQVYASSAWLAPIITFIAALFALYDERL
jgi:hypothetical protein